MTPNASSGLICEASSITRMSNSALPGGKNCATEIGLMSMTGLMRWTIGPAFRITQRIGLWPRFRAISPRMMPISPIVPRGICSKCRDRIRLRAVSMRSFSRSENRVTRSWRSSCGKSLSSGRARLAAFQRASAHA